MQAALPPLPPKTNVETLPTLRALAEASRALAELKGEAKTIPNEEILINTLALQEAKDSSAIENIITTSEELFLAQAEEPSKNDAIKEVQNYTRALKQGFELVKENKLLTINHILKIQAELEANHAGIRKQAGTVLKNSLGETVYTPPQHPDEISDLFSNLEKYINIDDFHAIDPLLKMPIVHYQFESIHPFYDGNGRTGRIINVLYLVQQGLLDVPILYLSRYIIKNKSEYYQKLQAVHSENDWEAWILWMLRGVVETAQHTLALIQEIKVLIEEHTALVKEKQPKIYSKALVENIFKHPYTKVEFLMQDLGVSKPTASQYLKKLMEMGILQKEKKWKTNYYINKKLYALFA